MTQGTYVSIIGGTPQEEQLQGSMLAADFEADTITFRMHGPYYAKAGTYVMIPLDEYNDMRERLGPQPLPGQEGE